MHSQQNIKIWYFVCEVSTYEMPLVCVNVFIIQISIPVRFKYVFK